nr:MAG TPA: hypothetical protein [Caudoviricetes sp.]
MFRSECIPIHNDSSSGVLRYSDESHLFSLYILIRMYVLF